MIVDLALSVTGSQLIANVLPQVRCFASPKSQIDIPSISGRQGSTYDAIRVYQRSYRDTPWMQDRIQGYLAFVRPLFPVFVPWFDFFTQRQDGSLRSFGLFSKFL